MHMKKIIETGKETLRLEAKALLELSNFLDENFEAAVNLILKTKGKLIFSGMGKAGLIAAKVAATFSSLGKASLYLHSGEASHGDLGVVSKDDLILFFSKSGESIEVVSILPAIKKLGTAIIVVSANKNSLAFKAADVPLYIGEAEEACGMNLAPTTSTTAMLAMGDALAVAYMREDPNFNEKTFALNHPGGSLGKSLARAEEYMRKDKDVVLVSADEQLKFVLFKMTRAGIGSALVIDENDILLGVFSDGDLRRLLENDEDFMQLTIHSCMRKNPRFIELGSLIKDCLHIFSQYKIGELPVLDKKKKVWGVLCLKDIV